MLKYYNRGTEKGYLRRWIDISDIERTPGMEERCTAEFLQDALKRFPGTKVLSVEIKERGECLYEVPDYCEVNIDHSTGHLTERIKVYIPFVWNERFFGIGGGGNHTGNFPFDVMAAVEYMRSADPATILMNGFAVADSDGAAAFCDNNFAIQKDGDEYDMEIVWNWIERSSHNAAVIGKAVTEALQGKPIKYSYFSGGSGGGRQGLMHAVYNPDDYDGIYSEAPAVNWHEFNMSNLWPILVMKEYDNWLPIAKLETFRAAVWEKYGGQEAYFAPGNIARPQFDAAALVGVETTAGVITELDAKVMQMIWDGARDADGAQLGYGIRPGCDSWCEKEPLSVITYMYDDNQDEKAEELYAEDEVAKSIPHAHAAKKENEDAQKVTVFKDGQYVEIDADEAKKDAVPVDSIIFNFSESHVGGWLLRYKDFEKDWDWHTLTIGEYLKLFREGKELFKDINSDKGDLRKFHDDGKKLILVHGTDDDLISVDSTMDFYASICDYLGGKEKAEECVRFYPIPGDGHGCPSKYGYGPSYSTVMTALMQWVEDGIEPAELKGQLFDNRRNEVVGVRPVPYLSPEPTELYVNK